jgi:protein TonB
MSGGEQDVSALEPMDWLDELEDEQRRRMRSALVASGVGHLLLVASLWIAPSPEPFVLPQAITVDLVASLPAAPAPPAAKPEPVPVPPKPAPPPPPKPKVKLLPKEAPTPVARPEPKPEPEIRRRERPKELSYEDALAKLRSEVPDTEPLVAPEPVARAEAPSAASSSPRRGIPVAPEVAAWNLAVMRHIRSNFIVPPEFRDSGLAARLVIDVADDGGVLGDPRVVGSSGNPYFDDNAVRTVKKASPLPPPPMAGPRTLIFTSEE